MSSRRCVAGSFVLLIPPERLTNGNALMAATNSAAIGHQPLYLVRALHGRLSGYVEGGGAYLGLCAGAYYACRRVEFEVGTRHASKAVHPCEEFDTSQHCSDVLSLHACFGERRVGMYACCACRLKCACRHAWTGAGHLCKALCSSGSSIQVQLITANCAGGCCIVY